jgi:hypothetical protein
VTRVSKYAWKNYKNNKKEYVEAFAMKLTSAQVSDFASKWICTRE